MARARDFTRGDRRVLKMRKGLSFPLPIPENSLPKKDVLTGLTCASPLGTPLILGRASTTEVGGSLKCPAQFDPRLARIESA